MQSLPRQRNAANDKFAYNRATRREMERPEGWLPPNALPTDIDLGPEWQVRWVRMYIDKAGTLEDKTAINTRTRRGWVIVQPEELPNHKSMHKDGMIQDANCVLMKVSKELIKHDVDHFERLAAGAYQGARTEFAAGASEDDLVQRFSENKRDRVFRGRLPT